MKFIMNLSQVPFEMMKNGRKTIELRLYDEKRKAISIGDVVRFYNLGKSGESLLTRVVDLYVSDSFKSLYEEIPLIECGYTEESVAEAVPEDMNMYYTHDEQQKYDVVGIRICLI